MTTGAPAATEDEPVTPEGAIGILVVDDDPLVRAGITSILSIDPGLKLSGEASDGLDALRMVKQTRPDIVLMDIRMPNMDGIEATHKIRRLPEPPHVIALTTFSMDDYVLAVLRAGASGFLLKDTHPREIISAIRTVHLGNALIDPAVTRQVIERLTQDHSDIARKSARSRIAALTATEQAVLARLALGEPNADIAKAMRVSESAVKAHVNRMYPKLGVGNRVQAAILAHDAQLWSRSADDARR